MASGILNSADLEPRLHIIVPAGIRLKIPSSGSSIC